MFGPYRWYYGGGYYGGYYGCCGAYYGGWSCCSTCYSDPCCCGDWSCCDGATVYSPAVAPAAGQPTLAPKAPEKAPEPPAAPKSGAMPGPVAPEGAKLPTTMSGPDLEGFFTDTRGNSGLLTIYVPYEAKVWINGRLTASSGSQRRYVSYGLNPGYRYKYEVRAQVPREGKMLEQVKTVYLTAGAREGVAFGFNQAPATLTAAK